MTNGLISSAWKGENGMTKSLDSAYEKIAEAAEFLNLDFSAEDMAAFAKENEVKTDSLRNIEELFTQLSHLKNQLYDR